jgi:hypothetical protein
VGAEGAVVCEKTLVYPVDARAQQPSPGISHRLVRDTYVPGATLHSAITTALRAADSQGVIARLRQWLDFLGEAAGAGTARDWDHRLPGEFWDCTPANLVQSKDGLRYIDAEWVSDPGPTLGTMLLRYLFILAYGEASAPSFAACFHPRPASAIRMVLDALGMPLTGQALSDFASDTNDKKVVLQRKDFLGRILHQRPGGASRIRRVAQDMVLKVMRGISGVLSR